MSFELRRFLAGAATAIFLSSQSVAIAAQTASPSVRYASPDDPEINLQDYDLAKKIRTAQPGSTAWEIRAFLTDLLNVGNNSANPITNPQQVLSNYNAGNLADTITKQGESLFGLLARTYNSSRLANMGPAQSLNRAFELLRDDDQGKYIAMTYAIVLTEGRPAGSRNFSPQIATVLQQWASGQKTRPTKVRTYHFAPGANFEVQPR